MSCRHSSCRLLFLPYYEHLYKVELSNLLTHEKLLFKLSSCILKATAVYSLASADCWCFVF